MTTALPLDPIETASRDELAALQLERLKWSLNHAYENSPVYRRKFDEAGVHPSEVKTLARRSAEATEDITSTVAAIQADTAAAAAALEEILHAIEMMDSEQTTIASAVEEQSMTAAEIGARVSAVARAAESSSSALIGLREAANVVAAKSHELRALV